MDKGIVVGVDQETILRRSLDFALFRLTTTTHLFLPPILRFHLTRDQPKEAIRFAAHYQHLVYFAHALEILLHDVLEDEADARPSSARSTTDAFVTNGESETAVTDPNTVLPRVVEFLDHFEEALQVVVGCARKTEITRWDLLFNVVGNPRILFEVSRRSLVTQSEANPCTGHRNVSMQDCTKWQRRTFSCCTTSNRWSRVVNTRLDYFDPLWQLENGL